MLLPKKSRSFLLDLPDLLFNKLDFVLFLLYELLSLFFLRERFLSFALGKLVVNLALYLIAQVTKQV